MTLQTSGNISLGDIAAEFGGSLPYTLGDYYAGGAYVPSGTSGIPSSGNISLGDFYGASAYTPLTLNISSIFEYGSANQARIYGTLYSNEGGGSGSYTYAWSYVSGSTLPSIDGSSTSDNLNLSCPTPGASGSHATVYRCIVTDANDSSKSITATATARFEWE